MMANSAHCLSKTLRALLIRITPHFIDRSHFEKKMKAFLCVIFILAFSELAFSENPEILEELKQLRRVCIFLHIVRF